MGDKITSDLVERWGVTRRQVLSSLGAGVALSGAGPAVEAATGSVRDPERVEIVTIRAGGEPVETKQVSERWYDALTEARRRKRAAFDALSRSDGDGIIAVTAGRRRVDGRPKPVVEGVVGGPRDRPRMAAESMADAISTVETLPITFDACGRQPYATVPGGVALNSGSVDPTAYSFSATCRVLTDSSGERLLTARHPFALPCNRADQTGEPVEQWGGAFGSVSAESCSLDAVLVDHDEGGDREGISPTIEHPGDEYPVGAHYTADGVADAVGRAPWAQHGLATCTTTPRIIATEAAYTVTCDRPDGSTTTAEVTDQIVREPLATSGDSGAPLVGVFQFYRPRTVVAGMHNGRTVLNGRPVAFGSAAYAIAEAFDVTFGPFRARE